MDLDDQRGGDLPPSRSEMRSVLLEHGVKPATADAWLHAWRDREDPETILGQIREADMNGIKERIALNWHAWGFYAHAVVYWNDRGYTPEQVADLHLATHEDGTQYDWADSGIAPNLAIRLATARVPISEGHLWAGREGEAELLAAFARGTE